MEPAAGISRPGAERPVYHVAAWIAALLAFAGFARTYYLKGAFGTPELPPLVHVHGVVMTLWIVMFFVQARLVAARRVDLHRRLGIAGAVLATLVVAVGVATAIEGARRGVSPGPPPLAFLVIPLGVVCHFGLFVGLALLLRGRRDWHRRLMLMGTLAVLTPAIARLPLETVHDGGILLYFALTDLLVLACLAWDGVANRRVHPAFAWGALVLLVSQPALLAVAGTEAWLSIARVLAG